MGNVLKITSDNSLNVEKSKQNIHRIKTSNDIYLKNCSLQSEQHNKNQPRSHSLIIEEKRSKTIKELDTFTRYSKTTWPIPNIDIIFLPNFKRANKLENFKFESQIAKGSFGTVFKVIKKQDNVEFALKVLHKSKIIINKGVQQTKNEVNIQKACGHHLFIVQHLDSWQNRRNLYILQEYISCGELFNKFFDFSFEQVRLYVAEIALAIDFLHNAGIIYRDVKSENILLNKDYHIKLTDFGLSKWLKIGERTRTMCGTFEYVAPEIRNGELYGHAIDWWSLGIIACKMITKEFPNTSIIVGRKISSWNEKEYLDIRVNFFPEAMQDASLEEKDLLTKILIPDSKTRLKSILGLQRIAMYKKFDINIKSLQQICPLELAKNSLKKTPSFVFDEFADF